jgi:hypothetical protein
MDKEGGLYWCENGCWFAHSPVICQQRLPAFSSSCHTCDPPCTFTVLLFIERDKIFCDGASDQLTHKTSSSSAASFVELIKKDDDSH